MKRWVLSLALPLALGGCDQLLKTSGANSLGALGAVSVGGGLQTTFSGQALGPSSLVGNNASNLVSNNVGNLISNNVNGLVSNNVSGLTTAAGLSQAFSVLSLSQVPLPETEVALLTLSGAVAATGTTDANGNFSLSALQSSQAYDVEVAYKVGASTVREDNLATGGPVQVDAASTLAIAALQSAIPGGSLQGYLPANVASVVSALRATLTDSAAQTLTGSSASRVAAFQQLALQNAAVESAYSTAVANAQARLSGTGGSSSSSTSSGSTTGSTSSSSGTSSSTSGSASSSQTLSLSQFATVPGISLGTDASGAPELVAASTQGQAAQTSVVDAVQGTTLRFDLTLGTGTQDGAFAGVASTTYPAFVQMDDANGNVLLQGALWDQTSGGTPSGLTACSSGTTQVTNTVACSAPDDTQIEFNLPVPTGVAKIVFGGAGPSYSAILEGLQILTN